MRAAYEALGIVERQVYLDYITAVFYPDFSGQLATWAAAYLNGLRAIDLSHRSPLRLLSASADILELINQCLSERPEQRPANGGAVLAKLSQIRASPSSIGPVFVSHAHGDKDLFVGAFVDALLERRVSVWYDTYDLRVGEPFWDRIFRAIQQARFVVVVLSKQMLLSNGVSEELRYAHLENLGRVKILPILIDDTPIDDLPPMLRSRHVLRFPPVNAQSDFESSVDVLVRHMRDLAGEQ